MSYTKTTRKFGAGELYYGTHAASGVATTPYWGEVDLAALLALTTNFGGMSADGVSMEFPVETMMDEISQEMSPVQMVVTGGGQATVRVTLSMGDATTIALAAGLTAVVDEDDILGSNDDAETIIIGARQPSLLSLLHKVVNPHNTSYYDYVYIPRAQVIPAPGFRFSRKDVRQVEVTFVAMASQQDGSTGTPTSTEMQLATGGGGVAKVLIQNAT